MTAFSFVPLTKDRFAIIDREDAEKLLGYSWMFHGGYARRAEKGKIVHMHRLLMDCPDEFEVDHINRNKLDNRKANLRIVTRQQNMFNKTGYAETSSRFKGVSWHSKDKLWHAQIRHDTKIKFIGAFEVEETAAAAYNHYAQLLFKEFAVLNEVAPVNFMAQRVIKKKGASKYRGVTFRKNKNMWVSRITVAGKRLELGYFKTEEEAAIAYNKAFEKHKKGKEVPNFI